MMKGNSSGQSAARSASRGDVKAALSRRMGRGPGRTRARGRGGPCCAKTRHSYLDVLRRWGGCGGLGGMGSSTTLVQDYKIGTVVVDIFAPRRSRPSGRVGGRRAVRQPERQFEATKQPSPRCSPLSTSAMSTFHRLRRSLRVSLALLLLPRMAQQCRSDDQERRARISLRSRRPSSS